MAEKEFEGSGVLAHAAWASIDVASTSGQNVGGAEACKSIVHVLSLRVCCVCSTRLFCWDVYGHVR
jgi:hypothetical protein